MIKIVSWNVNGIRAILKKGLIEVIKELNPDIIAFQEIKAQKEDVNNIAQLLPEYPFISVNSAKLKKGYSGTAIFSKTKPVKTSYDMGIEQHDQEGRVIHSEYQNFNLVNVYVPNSKRGLVRLDYRKQWDNDFKNFLIELNNRKPTILCGDLNVAHQAIDLANPKPNYNKTAGYTQVEIDGFTDLLNSGFIDVYRYLYPEKIEYTYWSYLFNARENNTGWRIYYFVIPERFISKISDMRHFKNYQGSDHCPIELSMDI